MARTLRKRAVTTSASSPPSATPSSRGQAEEDKHGNGVSVGVGGLEQTYQRGVWRTACELVLVLATVILVPAVILIVFSATMRGFGADIELPQWSLVVLNAAGVSPTAVAATWPPVSYTSAAQGVQGPAARTALPSSPPAGGPPTTRSTSSSSSTTTTTTTTTTTSRSLASMSDSSDDSDFLGKLTMAEHLAHVALLDAQGRVVDAERCMTPHMLMHCRKCCMCAAQCMHACMHPTAWLPLLRLV
jgi:hypothetical protein